MAVLTLHNWLKSGKLKTVFMLPGFWDTYDSTTQSFIPGQLENSKNLEISENSQIFVPDF